MMMNWEWHSARTEDGLNNGSIIVRHCGMIYALAKAPRYMPEKEWESIAPILAAAPELLEALEAMLTFYGMDEEPGEVSEVIHKQARAAIAKARPTEMT